MQLLTTHWRPGPSRFSLSIRAATTMSVSATLEGSLDRRLIGSSCDSGLASTAAVRD